MPARCQAEFCTANVVSDRHRRVGGSDPDRRLWRLRSLRLARMLSAATAILPSARAHADDLTPRYRLARSRQLDHCVQVRKIAIRITMTAITATAVFVSVTNVRYVCS